MPRLNFHVLLVTCASVKLCTAWPTRGVLTAGDEPSPSALSFIQQKVSPSYVISQDAPGSDTEYRPFSWCEVWELIVPVCLSLFGGWSFVYLVMSFMAKGQEDKAVLAMSVLSVFVENLLYSSVFVDSLDFAYNLMESEAQSGFIVGIHKMGTSAGTILVFCMFILYPEIWRYRGLSVMLAGFTTQCVGAVTFGLCGLGNVYMGASGRSFDVVVLLARFLQGTGGGLQVAFGLMQTALLLTGLERSIQNTRFYLGACLGMGTGPLLSSLSTSSARLAHCISKPGYEATFAVCTLLPLIQLPMLRWAPKRVHGRGSASQGSSAQYCYQRMLVIILCVILQSIRSFSSAAVEAALSQLLYTDYQLTRRWTGVITAALMFTMLPAQIFYEQLGRRFSVNRVIRFLLLMALVGSSLNLFESWLGLVASACLVLPSLALSSGLIMGTMQVHQIPNSYIFDLNGTTLLSLILSDLLGRGIGPVAARHSIASGGQHGFGEQQLLSPKTSKEVRGFEDPSNAEADLLLDDIEVGSHCSKTSVAALPVLSEDKDLKEELPMTLTEMSQEKVLAEESTTEGHSGPKFSWEAGAGSGRRTRLELRAVDSHWRLESSEIHMKKELSKTLKSTLYLATWKGTEVVMKCVQIPEEPIGIKFSSESITASRPMQGNDVDEKLLEELLHEIELLSSLRHPDLVLFIGACLDKDSPVMCITEYMPGGDLERYYMAKRNQNQTDRWRPPLQQILDWCSAVARALSFLHTRDEPIVHRDLKPLNLLLTKHLEVKIADLGISKMMAAVASDVYNMTGGVGSWLYMAPEVVRHQHYNEKVDIYAFALIMFFMSAGKAPFHEMGKDPELVLKEYVKGNEPRPSDSECHSQLRPIMKAAWAVDYKERPSAERMVEQFQHVKEDYTPGGSCFCSKA